MKCTCGNISRFEVYRLELKRLVLDYKLIEHRLLPHRSAIEHARVVETGVPLAVRCIKCGTEGPPEDFHMTKEDTDRMREEDREGFHIPKAIPPLSKWHGRKRWGKGWFFPSRSSSAVCYAKEGRTLCGDEDIPPDSIFYSAADVNRMDDYSGEGPAIVFCVECEEILYEV